MRERRCHVCMHPDLAAIDRALVEGTPQCKIVAQYGFSTASVCRHAARHLPAKLVKVVKAQAAAEVARREDLASRAVATEAREVAEGLDLFAKLGEYEGWLRGVVAIGKRDNDLRLSVTAIGQLLRLCELLAKIRGELDERPQVNILVSPQFLQVRSALLVALEPFPEAWSAVSGALLELEAGS